MVIDTKTFLKKQFVTGIFNRYDIFVRLLFIDAFYNNDKIGFEMYKKQEQLRTGCSERQLNKYIDNYRLLIESVEKNGILEQYPIVCNKTFNLTDGAHRFACSIYFKSKNIFYEINNGGVVHYSKKWFIENNFTKEEIDKIENKKEDIFNEYRI